MFKDVFTPKAETKKQKSPRIDAPDGINNITNNRNLRKRNTISWESRNLSIFVWVCACGPYTSVTDQECGPYKEKSVPWMFPSLILTIFSNDNWTFGY